MYTHLKLTTEEENRLVLKAQYGNVRARNFLVRNNLPRVMFLANRLSRDEHVLADLFQEGVLGIVHAISKFDPDRGPFGIFAERCIRNYMGDWLRNIRYAPDASKLSAESEDLEDYRDALVDEGASPEDATLSSECTVKMSAVIEQIVDGDEPARVIVESRILTDEYESLESVGERLGLSGRRVGQIEREIMERIRDATKACFTL